MENTVKCPKCGKEVKAKGLSLHMTRVHKPKAKTPPPTASTIVGTRVNRAPYAVGLYLSLLKAERKAEKKEEELNHFLVTLSEDEFREYMTETIAIDKQNDAKTVVKPRR